ncbi:MAG: tautomerase family protein [Thermomicrobiales bacterium]
MSQVIIYGNARHLNRRRQDISDAIHQSLVSAIGLPVTKRFQRFIDLSSENFIYLDDRSDTYTIIEISMFEGRSVEAKKQLIRLIYATLQADCDLDPQDVEITIFETPASNWGIRGLPADELTLPYKVDV